MAYSRLASQRQTFFLNSCPKNGHSSVAYGDGGKAIVADWIVIANEIAHLSVVDFLHIQLLPSPYFC